MFEYFILRGGEVREIVQEYFMLRLKVLKQESEIFSNSAEYIF